MELNRDRAPGISASPPSGDLKARRKGYYPDSCAIGVIAKSPRPGHSKTRLCPPLTPEEAAQLSGAFLRDTTESLASAKQMAPIVGYAAYAPLGTEHELLPHLAATTTCILADGTGPALPGVEGFGRCLLHAITGLFSQGHSAACVLSSDTPTLPTAFLVSAAEHLLAGDERRVVLGACDDGGYYLLGMRAPHAGLFKDITWSTNTVAAATRERALGLGLELIELPQWYDIDDAVALQKLLLDSTGYPAAFTRKAVGSLRLMNALRVPRSLNEAIAAAAGVRQ
jgi:glycosyltransferase A (GT-A) superfamily protein (DUF2064 family)